MTLTLVVKFTNILQAAFVPIFFFKKKITEPNCMEGNATQNTFVQKAACNLLVKLTPSLI